MELPNASSLCIILLHLLHQIKSEHTNKNALTPRSRKSMVRPYLFICWRNLISEATVVAFAFSSIIIIMVVCRAWPCYKPSEPHRKPLLVPRTDPWLHVLSPQVTRDLSVLCCVLRSNSLYVCLLGQNWRKATGCICRWNSDQLRHTAANTSSHRMSFSCTMSDFCPHPVFFFESVCSSFTDILDWRKWESGAI